MIKIFILIKFSKNRINKLTNIYTSILEDKIYPPKTEVA